MQVQAKEVKKGASSPVKAGTPPAAASTAGGADLDSKIKEQGEKVRQLKAQKAAKVSLGSPGIFGSCLIFIVCDFYSLGGC